jgi:hypothetical protein
MQQLAVGLNGALPVQTHSRWPLGAAWLDPQQQDGAAALSHFQPVRVSTYVNSSKNEGPKCIEPIAQDEETTSSDPPRRSFASCNHAN